MHCKMKPEPKHLLEEVANGFTCRLAVSKIRPELNLASWIIQEVVLLVMPLASQIALSCSGHSSSVSFMFAEQVVTRRAFDSFR